MHHDMDGSCLPRIRLEHLHTHTHTHTHTCSPAGVVRPTPDGRYEAYMIPPAAANHASFLELLPDGELLLAWFAGTAEGANNCSIVLARLPGNGTQWSAASLISRRDGYSNQNPVLFLDPTGQVRRRDRKSVV